MKSPSIVVLLILLLATTWALAAHDHLKTGNIGLLIIHQPLQVNGDSLPAGEYEVRHVTTSPSAHHLEFTRVTHVAQTDVDGPTTPYERQVAARVNCKIEVLDRIVSETSLQNEGSRVVKVEIKGENVAHSL